MCICGSFICIKKSNLNSNHHSFFKANTSQHSFNDKNSNDEMTNQHLDENSSKYSDHMSQRADPISPIQMHNEHQSNLERHQSESLMESNKKSPKPTKSKKSDVSTLENTALNMSVNGNNKKATKKTNGLAGPSTQASKLNGQNSNKRKLNDPYQTNAPIKAENTHNNDDLHKMTQEISYLQSTSQNSSSTTNLLNQLVSKQQNPQQQQQSSTLLNPASNDYMQMMFYQANMANALKNNTLLSNFFNMKMPSLMPNLNTSTTQSQVFNQNNCTSKISEKVLPKSDGASSKPTSTNQQLDSNVQKGKCAESNGNVKDVLDLSLPNRSRSSFDSAKIGNISNTVIIF